MKMRIVVAMVASGLLLSAMTSRPEAKGLDGRGGIGGNAGIMKFVSGEDWKDGSARFILQVAFKYNISEHWAVTLESGWGWNNYGAASDVLIDPADSTSTDDVLGQVIPSTLGIQYRFQMGDTEWWPAFGLGGGLYAMGVKDTPNSWAENPDTGARLTWTKPGFFGKMGVERMFGNTASMNFDLLGHYVLAENEDLISPGFDRFVGDNLAFVEFRVGANFYFNVGGGGDEAEAFPEDEVEN